MRTPACGLAPLTLLAFSILAAGCPPPPSSGSLDLSAPPVQQDLTGVVGDAAGGDASIDGGSAGDGGGSDSEAPVLTIVGPLDGATELRGNAIMLAGMVTDNVGVASLSLRVRTPEGNLYSIVLPSGTSFARAIPTVGMAAGAVSLTVTARDAAGNTAMQTRSVTLVNNSPAPTAVLSNLPPLLHNQSDLNVTVGGSGVVSYRYQLDSEAYSADTSTTTSIARVGLSDGSHTLRVLGKNALDIKQDGLSPTTFTWTIDTSPADTMVTSLPAAVTSSTSLNVSVLVDSATGVVGSTATGEFQVRVQSAAPTTPPGGGDPSVIDMMTPTRAMPLPMPSSIFRIAERCLLALATGSIRG